MLKVYLCGGFIIFLSLTLSESHIFMKDGFLGVGIDLSKYGFGGKCPSSANLTCACGNGQPPVNISIPICSITKRFKTRCKPCTEVNEEKVCQNYENCVKCHSNSSKGCSKCSNNKFGKWCEKDCDCVNGATCDKNGKCVCPDGYEGRNCEDKKGCLAPGPLIPPVRVVLNPPDIPHTAAYSCPHGHELKGSAFSTCLNNKEWSSEPPICLPVCPLLSSPANGGLKFSSNELIEGDTAEVICNSHHRLIGEKIVTCLADGRWSGELATCEKLAFCPDPGDVQNAERTVSVESVKLGGNYLQDSMIHFKCFPGYEQMGTNDLLCLFDGTWSDNLPSCLKVSTIVPSCHTKGSDVVSEIGVSVRLVCPPECADENFNVWGTSIYRQDSSVCQAAIHSAKITNSGGSVNVINNGEYSHFTGSYSNNIESESFSDRDKSFRFDRLEIQRRSGNPKDCEKGLVKLANSCVYISNNLRTKQEAEAICSNLKMELQLPDADEERLRLVTELNARNINFIWDSDKELVSDVEIANDTDTPNPNKNMNSCQGATFSHLELKKAVQNCNQPSNFACIAKSESLKLAICEDPGALDNGNAQPVGQIDGVFYVGSSIEFSCQSLHYLKGVDVISCTANGSWSEPKPSCIKVNACEDPPIPIGGFVMYLPPLKTPAAQRAAIHRGTIASLRNARLPAGLSGLPRNGGESIPTTVEPETISLPPGLHRIGARAMYDCESRYYKLIGSKTRRCQGEGEWSGRPPTCIPVCGRSDSPRTPFVVNGNATDIGQWPWQAGIARYLPDYNSWFLLCGASLLSEIWVITAAHCVTYAGTTLLIEPDKFQVYMGKYHRQDSKDDEYVQVRKMKEIHIHPDFDPGLFDADIALIQLDAPVQLNSRVQPVCLPSEHTTRENLVEGKRGVVTGWGMNENDTYSETLQQAVLPVVSQGVCEKGYLDSDLPLTVTDNMFCAGYAKGRSDACSGDSGGPMVFTDDSAKERKWVLEGIVSWGSPQGCGNPNQYGGFTTVSKFLDWIHLFF